MALNVPKKYSAKSLELLKKIAKGTDNEISIPSDAKLVDMKINENVANKPITKNTVIDVFNTLVIENLNLLPKYSSNLAYLELEDFNLNSEMADLANALGDPATGSDYGFMALYNNLKLSDFKDLDKDNQIEVQDLIDTYKNVIGELCKLTKLNIKYQKGNLTIKEEEVACINNVSNTINTTKLDSIFNSLKNTIIQSNGFNEFCSKLYDFVYNTYTNSKLDYPVKLPSTVIADNVDIVEYIKFILIRWRPSGFNKAGNNSWKFNDFFGRSQAFTYLKLPKVTRNIKSIKIRLDRWNHTHSLEVRMMLINFTNSTIIGFRDWQGVGGTSTDHTFEFTSPVKLTTKPYDDIILKLDIRAADSDSGDATGVIFRIKEVLYDDNVVIDNNGLIENKTLEYINNEFNTNPVRNDNSYTIAYEYKVPAGTRKFKYLIFSLRDYADRLLGSNYPILYTFFGEVDSKGSKQYISKVGNLVDNPYQNGQVVYLSDNSQGNNFNNNRVNYLLHSDHVNNQRFLINFTKANIKEGDTVKIVLGFNTNLSGTTAQRTLPETKKIYIEEIIYETSLVGK